MREITKADADVDAANRAWGNARNRILVAEMEDLPFDFESLEDCMFFLFISYVGCRRILNAKGVAFVLNAAEEAADAAHKEISKPN